MPIKDFLIEIDLKWKPLGAEPVLLQVIGSAALMLQCDYERGTKDGDVLESGEVSPPVKKQLKNLAGKGTDIHKQFHIYIDIVKSVILFAPQKLLFHPVRDLSLKNFQIEALDVLDVVISKLPRLNQNDMGDVQAMADKGLLDHKKLITRFQSAVDMFSIDARSDDLPLYIKNLRIIERDILDVQPAEIHLPDWMQ